MATEHDSHDALPDPGRAQTHGHGPIRLLTERCCTTPACLRPARELGGLCTHCWRGTSPEERALLHWEASLPALPVAPFDVVAAAESILRDAA